MEYSSKKDKYQENIHNEVDNTNNIKKDASSPLQIIIGEY